MSIFYPNFVLFLNQFPHHLSKLSSQNTRIKHHLLQNWLTLLLFQSPISFWCCSPFVPPRNNICECMPNESECSLGAMFNGQGCAEWVGDLGRQIEFSPPDRRVVVFTRHCSIPMNSDAWPQDEVQSKNDAGGWALVILSDRMSDIDMAAYRCTLEGETRNEYGIYIAIERTIYSGEMNPGDNIFGGYETRCFS